MKVKAEIFDEIVEGELVDDDEFIGGTKFIYNNGMNIVSIELIDIIDLLDKE